MQRIITELHAIAPIRRVSERNEHLVFNLARAKSRDTLLPALRKRLLQRGFTEREFQRDIAKTFVPYGLDVYDRRGRRFTISLIHKSHPLITPRTNEVWVAVHKIRGKRIPPKIPHKLLDNLGISN